MVVGIDVNEVRGNGTPGCPLDSQKRDLCCSTNSMYAKNNRILLYIYDLFYFLYISCNKKEKRAGHSLKKAISFLIKISLRLFFGPLYFAGDSQCAPAKIVSILHHRMNGYVII